GVVAMFCPFICREIRSGVASSQTYPISLPPWVNPPTLRLIFYYYLFHQMCTKRICELTLAADSLHLRTLSDLTIRTLARVIEGKSPIREIFHLADDLAELGEMRDSCRFIV
ncbi:ubiquitin-protein ligase, partial [Striga asiatica]